MFRGIVAAAAAAFLLAAGAASAELAKWDQARVAKYAEELSVATKDLKQSLDDIGIQVHRPTAAELASFHAPAQAARKTYLASASAGEKALAAQIDTALAAYRSGQR